jgi:hypothetical protein
MLGHLFYRFLPFGTPGFRVNCLSCVCGATAALLLFLFCQRWYAARGYRASCGWALLAAGCWAFSPLLWQYHVQAEVFSLNNLIVAAQFLLAQLHSEACMPVTAPGASDTDPVSDARRLRARSIARLGALLVGLGFSNQHAVVFYSVPIVVAVLITDASTHANVMEASFFLQLAACGLLGLTPYLLMPWSASRGELPQLGSWGDQRTVEGLIRHFLRREYGTFRLYSGSDAVYTSMLTWIRLYGASLSENFLVVGPLLLLAGLLCALRAWRRDSMGALVAGCLLFYFIIFHTLANLNINDKTLLGVHMRFWMQAHLLSSALMVPGAKMLLQLGSRLDLDPSRTPPSWQVLAGAAAVVSLQGGLHYKVSDQSGNYYFEQYGRSMLAGAGADAIVLSKGDNVVNTMRYLQRCENHRLDVRLVDQSMMSHAWFKVMHGPHLPGVVFPGDVAYFAKEDNLKPYSTADFLEHNYKDRGPHIYICGGFKEFDDIGGKAFQGAGDFRTIPAGVCERIVRSSEWRSVDPRQVLRENAPLDIHHLYTKKTLKSLYVPELSEITSMPKDSRVRVQLEKYDARTWERSIHTHSTQAVQRLAHWLVMWSQRNDDNTDAFELSLKIITESFKMWPDTDLHLSSIAHRLYAIGCARLMNKRAQKGNMTMTFKVQKKDCNSQLVVEHMRQYIALEALDPNPKSRLNTDTEKKIVRSHTHTHAHAHARACMPACMYI